MRRPVLLDSKQVEIEFLLASVDTSETNDVRSDKAHKVSLVSIERLVDGPLRSKISWSGGEIGYSVLIDAR